MSDLGDDLLGAIRSAQPLAGHVDATAVLRTPAGEAWTVRFHRGRPAIAVGADATADTVVTGGAGTLRALAQGRVSGIEAFLDGDIVVRGDLSLSLRMAGSTAWARPTRRCCRPCATSPATTA